MGRMNRLKAKANKHFNTTDRLRAAGRHEMCKPLEAARTDHQRAGDAYRETKQHKGPNATPWKGAKGKQKLTRGPMSPKV